MTNHSCDCDHKGTSDQPDKIRKKGIRGLFSVCAAGCTGSAAGSAALSHLGCCVILPIVAGLSGAATSAALHTAIFVASPVIAAGTMLGIEKLRGKKILNKSSAVKAGASATLALAMTFAVHAITGHDHDECDHHGCDTQHHDAHDLGIHGHSHDHGHDIEQHCHGCMP